MDEALLTFDVLMLFAGALKKSGRKFDFSWLGLEEEEPEEPE